MSQPARVGDRMRPGEAGGIDDDGEHERLQDELLELEHRIASTRARSLTGAPLAEWDQVKASGAVTKL